MYQIILCTCPSNEVAKLIATTLVEEKLAACVNIIPAVTSVYHWNDNVVFDNEIQLVIKSSSELYKLIEEKINVLHPYDVPEIIAVNIQQGDEKYLHWIKESIKS